MQNSIRFKLTSAAVFVSIGLLSVLCDTARARAADFQYPLAVTATDDGAIFVADRNLPGIWQVKDGKVEKYFEGSKKFRTPLNAVRCVAMDHEGHLLAGDSSTREVYRFSEPGQPTPLTDGYIGIPMAMAVAPDGTIFVADIEVHRIWKMPAAGSKEPEEFAVITAPRGLALDDKGRLWVVSTSSQKGQVLRVLPDGTIETVVEGLPFELPHNIVLGPDDTAFVSDNYARSIWKVEADGKTSKWIEGDPLNRPVGLARMGDVILIADPHAKTIFGAKPDATLEVIAGP